MNIDNFDNSKLYGPDDSMKHDSAYLACGAFGNSIDEVKINLKNNKIFPVAPQVNLDFTTYYKINVLDSNKKETSAMRDMPILITYKYFYLVKYRKYEPKDEEYRNLEHPTIGVKWTQEKPLDPPANIAYYKGSKS